MIFTGHTRTQTQLITVVIENLIECFFFYYLLIIEQLLKLVMDYDTLAFIVNKL